jgi:hypothetical protein
MLYFISKKKKKEGKKEGKKAPWQLSAMVIMTSQPTTCVTIRSG